MNMFNRRRFRGFRESGDGCCGGFNMSPCVIPNFGGDHNYTDSIWQGEDPATNRKNFPAIRAAQTAGGTAYGPTISNGINKPWSGNPMSIEEINPRFRKLYNGRESDAFHHESYDICSLLSEIGRRHGY